MILRRFLSAAGLLTVCAPAAPVAVVVPQSEQIDLEGPGGRVYRLLVHRPAGPAPEGGHPVIYLLDGNAVFATAVEAMRLQSARPTAIGVAPAVIVGLGYPIAGPIDVQRRVGNYTPAPAGEADAFADFIETVVKPRIAAGGPVDPRRQSLVGHSLGGTFVLHVLFTRPQAFAAYVAASPAIWWADKVVLKTEAALPERLAAAPGPVRLLITTGALEQTVAPGTPEPMATRLRAARMVDNAAELAQRLAGLSHPKLAVAHRDFPEENHVSVIPAVISRALRFVSEPPR